LADNIGRTMRISKLGGGTGAVTVDAEGAETFYDGTASISLPDLGDTISVVATAAGWKNYPSPGSAGIVDKYGGIYVKDGSTAQTTLGTTQKKMTGFAADSPSSGVTPAHASDQITILTAGDYEVHFQNSFSGSVSAEFQFFARIDGVETSLGCKRKLGTGGDVGSCSFTGILTLAVNEVLTVYVETDNGSDTDSMTPVDSQFWVKKLL